jgi:hypothetical protein
MRRQAGIEHGRDRLVVGKTRREQRRAFGLRFHPHFQRAQSAHQEPRLERPEDRAVMAAHLLDARP